MRAHRPPGAMWFTTSPGGLRLLYCRLVGGVGFAFGEGVVGVSGESVVVFGSQAEASATRGADHHASRSASLNSSRYDIFPCFLAVSRHPGFRITEL
jgi:hypothetical protein